MWPNFGHHPLHSNRTPPRDTTFEKRRDSCLHDMHTAAVDCNFVKEKVYRWPFSQLRLFEPPRGDAGCMLSGFIATAPRQVSKMIEHVSNMTCVCISLVLWLIPALVEPSGGAPSHHLFGTRRTTISTPRNKKVHATLCTCITAVYFTDTERFQAVLANRLKSRPIALGI